MFTLVAPAVKPSLPVAVDLAGMQKDVAGAWFLLPFTSTRGPEHAGAQHHGEARAEERGAATTSTGSVRTRARPCGSSRGSGSSSRRDGRRAKYEDIRVLFADEPAGSIAPLPG